MRTVLPLLAATGMLAACGESASPSRVDELVESADRIAAASAPETLAGSWRVVAINGEVLAASEMVELTAGEQELWWEPRCAGFVHGYTLEGNSLLVGSRVTSPPAASSTPAPVCAIAIPRRLHEVGQVLRGAGHLELGDDTGEGHSLLISGKAGSLSLLSN